MHRPAQRLTRILACAAAVPVILAASGCSSDSGSSDAAKTGSDPKASASSSATGGDAGSQVKPATYKTLPDPCSVLSKKTLRGLVPESKSGKQGQSDDTSLRGTCSWSSLDNNGVKGSQFRWLNVSMLRFESDQARGSGDKLASQYYAKQVSEAQATDGAKNAKTEPVTGTGDEATAVHYDLKKKEGSFKQQTIVARAQNVVVTIDYNGAGLAGDKTPDGAELLKDAEAAAKEAVAAIVKANGSGASPSSSKSSSAKSDTKSSSKSGSKSGN
ncbi:DUF3558 family protein [Streptomyces sp. NPDC002004]